MEEIKVPQQILFILNQVFEMEQKIQRIEVSNTLQRNIDKLKYHFKDGMLENGAGLVFYNPIGEKYDETRTDCEASISGTKTDNLRIIEVIKPIIRMTYNNKSIIVQKAVVIVESKR